MHAKTNLKMNVMAYRHDRQATKDFRNRKMNKQVIIGLYGCYCHSFNTWEECNIAHNQILTIGQPILNRHTGLTGEVATICKKKGFVIVKYGENPCDMHLEHVASLIKLK